MNRRIALRSSLPPAECLARLASHMDAETFVAGIVGKRRFKGGVDGEHFWVSRKKTIRDDFAPKLVGRVRAWDGATLIDAEFTNVFDLRAVAGLSTAGAVALSLFFRSLEPLQYLLAVLGAIGFVALSGTPDRDALLALLRSAMAAEER